MQRKKCVQNVILTIFKGKYLQAVILTVQPNCKPFKKYYHIYLPMHCEVSKQIIGLNHNQKYI